VNKISKGNSRVFCAKRSERESEQGHEMAYKKIYVLTKMLRDGAF
jgi:hypothetical protein